ncbi:MAG: RagB/SusD family nutrient uptake outer membrane protein [Candidatus Pseudobacter hemicellulosilyticus]|uniref:RagB/SusD family nutrient uptake outer membrane protein n=1 Tax=Candidatus Pseudobacter hemicellulosilyticus TaxID=3121375 RepID=A0AAJ6BHZ2_9BACT|nr:MAG: RagB/SusD family nutrient uptake outer membrane protein [Pseudobacter sp.]
MKKVRNYIGLVFLLLAILPGCSKWMDRDSRDILTEDQAFSSYDGVNSIIAGFYSRLRDEQDFITDGNSEDINRWDEALRGTGVYNQLDYGIGYRTYWDYTLIRDINVFLRDLEEKGSQLRDTDKKFFHAEGRFLRAYVYFELVKRMGGVPLVTEVFDYTAGAKAEDYTRPRAKESEVYDFIGSEVDAIKEDLVTASPAANRASKGAALALKSRTMLYAATIAKYTPDRPALNLTTPGGEVGIDAQKANDYFRSSLAASEELLLLNYSLYNAHTDKATNFYEMGIRKTSNPELIFIKDYDGVQLLNQFTGRNIARSIRSTAIGGSLTNPVLNLLEDYEKLDNTEAAFVTLQSGSETVEDMNSNSSALNYKVYDNAGDIFLDRDPRLQGTVLAPGSSFKGKNLQFWAGLAVWNAGTGGYDFRYVQQMNDLLSTNNQLKYYDGRQITGDDGPHRSSDDVSHTGFLLRKYVDQEAGADVAGKSTVAYIRFRLGEIYLNAAEAAFELNEPAKALGWIRDLRRRAGFPVDITSVTLEAIRHERRVELAFEDHRFYDAKRWRIADQLWDGGAGNEHAVLRVLWPYKVYRPGHASDGKWIYRRMKAIKRVNPLRFLAGNYYSEIPADAISRNPLLVKNPNH